MSFQERIKYESFVENKDITEDQWHITFGDRKNELVFIGQDMDTVKIKEDLERCLCDDEEIKEWKAKIFPIRINGLFK